MEVFISVKCLILLTFINGFKFLLIRREGFYLTLLLLTSVSYDRSDAG